MVAEVKRFASGTAPSDTTVYFEPHFTSATSATMITGVDATADVCLSCAAGLQYALQGNASSSETA
eukprot:4822605-Prymnesium_polylepis.1